MHPDSAGPPPGLLEMLQGGGGAPPEQAPEPAPDQGGGSPEDEPISILKQMIKLGQQYQAVEPDAEDKATMAKLLATLHTYLAKDQQDAEAALGGGSATRVLRKLG
jgi:hypothetical protein